ncbi:MAG TPA: hypothetical protein VFS96_07030 [Nitrolancea sp.]|nr:hypothetical protein [Nitrolancea sp.]
MRTLFSIENRSSGTGARSVSSIRRRLADDLPGLRATADAFLAQFAAGSPDLLRYVGLLKED